MAGRLERAALLRVRKRLEMAGDTKGRITETCQAGEEFVKLFYETFDKRRHLISKFYLDTATLIWNGHSATGPAGVLKFLENLPTSEHVLESYDAQPISGDVTQGQTSIVVTTSGTVKYQNNKMKAFNENFILTAQDNTWKIVSDCMRTAD